MIKVKSGLFVLEFASSSLYDGRITEEGRFFHQAHEFAEADQHSGTDFILPDECVDDLIG